MRSLALVTAILTLAGCQQSLHLYDIAHDDAGHDAARAATGGKSGKGGSSGTDGGGTDMRCSSVVSVIPDTPQMVVVLDRSTSMNQPFGSQGAGGSMGQLQLNAAMSALTAQVNLFGSNSDPRASIRFSFVDFPDTGGACQGTNACCGSDAKDWATLQKNIYACESSPPPDSCTPRPMAAALTKADSILTGSNSAPPYERYVLLVTNGPPSGCGGFPDDCNATSPVIETLAEDKIILSILGLAPNQDSLGCLTYPYNSVGQPVAQAVADAQPLRDALDVIMQTAGCTASLNPAPASSDLTVTLPDGVVAPDRTNGWTYDMFGRLHLHGMACQSVLSGAGWNNLKVTAACGPGHGSGGPP